MLLYASIYRRHKLDLNIVLFLFVKSVSDPDVSAFLEGRDINKDELTEFGRNVGYFLMRKKNQHLRTRRSVLQNNYHLRVPMRHKSRALFCAENLLLNELQALMVLHR